MGADFNQAAPWKGVRVYVVDSGINVKHTEFSRGNAKWDYTTDRRLIRGVDENGHGTHIAATIGGKNVGIAPEAEIFAIKACNKEGRCTSFDLILALTRVCKEATNLARPKVII